MMRLGITTKLALAFIAFAALLLLGVGTFQYLAARDALRAAAVSELLATGLEKQAAFESWVAQRLASLQRFAGLRTTLESARELRDAERGSQRALAARGAFAADARNLIGPARVFVAVRLIDDEGRVLASTVLDEEGGVFGASGLAVAREAAHVEPLPPLDAGLPPRFRLGAPVFDVDGRRLAVMYVDVDLGSFQEILARRSGIRRSHDLFLADSTGRYITHPRLVAAGVRLDRLNDAIGALCAQREDGISVGADYRGVSTIAAVRWVPALQACLVVKLDEDEAYEPVRELRDALLVAGLLVLAFGSWAAWLLARVVTRRLRRLQRAVAHYSTGARGELPDTVVAGDDEIAQLGRELGDMMQNLGRAEQELRDHATRLELRVAERTAELQDSEVRFRTTAASALDPLVSVGEDLRIVFFNPAAERTFGASATEMQGRPLERMFASSSLAALDAALEAAQRRTAEDPGRTVELAGRRASGEEFPLEASIAAWATGGRHFYTLILRDITERKALLDALRELSLRDELTGLHNRRGFFALAAEHGKLSLRRQRPYSLVFIDLDGFKRINDSYGHEAGDRVLQAVAGMLKQVFRDSDIVARLGGDEFVALLADTDGPAAQHSVERLKGLVATYANEASDAERVGFSFGLVSFDPAAPRPLDQLLTEADELMYAQKKQRKGGAGA